MTNPNWFQGTADAVRQHLHRFTGREAIISSSSPATSFTA